MKKFIVIYHTPIEAAMQMANISPEYQAKGREDWLTWAQKCGAQLVDMEAPLMNGQRVSPDGKSSPSTKEINGYSILQSENMESAKALLNGHPI